jgi:hypothetical protein
MKDINLFFIGLLMCLPAFAQEKETFRMRYVNHTEAGVLLGQVKYGGGNGVQEISASKQSITAQMYQGIQLSRAFSAGVTIGMDWYKAALINPVALGVRYDITKGHSARLYASADAGYGFAWFHSDSEGFNTKGGLMVNPGIGIKYGKPDGAAFTIGISWRRQEAKVSKPPLWQQTERHEERVYNRLALRIGMSF